MDTPLEATMPRGVAMEKRQRRKFTDEFKAKAVQLIQSSNKTVAQVARDLDLSASSLGNWLKQAEIDAGRGPAGALTTEERAELSQLRKENRILKEEREILEKAAVRSHGECNTWYDAVDGKTRTTRAFGATEEAALEKMATRRIAQRHWQSAR